jgi:hypothetical protein
MTAVRIGMGAPAAAGGADSTGAAGEHDGD